MSTEKNHTKQATYAERKVQLKKAMKSGFYFEAIFLEYAILEDRTESVLRHAGGIKLVDKNGNPLTLYAKTNKIRSCAAFSAKFVRQRLTLELLDSLDSWRECRNKLVHCLMKNQTVPEELRIIAKDGNELVKVFDNKVKSVNHYFDKVNGNNDSSEE